MDHDSHSTPDTGEHGLDSDLSTVTNTGLEPQPLSPREAAMQSIVDAQLTDAESETTLQPLAKPEPVLPESLPVYQNDAGDYLMRLKVDGAEQEMSLADVQATMQKHQAADLRLRQAADAKRQIDDERRVWQEQMSQQQQQPPAGAEANADNLEQAHQMIDTLYDGDTEQAAVALAKMMGQPQTTQPSITPELIATEARRAVKENEYDKNLKTGFAKFQDEYADVLADPDLRDMADKKTLDLQTLHPDWSPEQILMESGRVVRSKFQPAQQQPVDTRQARKQGLPSMPQRQSNATYVPPAKGEPSNNPSDVIAQMKRARNQH